MGLLQVIFEKQRHCGSYINELLIQCDTDSCCKHLIGDVNIHLYVCVILLVPVCPVYVFVCLCRNSKLN